MSRQEAFKKLAPIAHRIAQRYIRKIPAHELTYDLVNVALMGVWEAVTRRYKDGVPAMTALATIRAQGAVIDYLRARDWATRHSRKIGNPAKMLYIGEHEESGGFTFTAREQRITPEDEADANQTVRQRNIALEEALALLSAKDRYVMRRLLSGVAQKDVAAELGLSAPRISQIMQAAIPRLQAHVSRVLRRRKL